MTIALIPGLGGASNAQGPAITDFYLDNGLHVVVIPDRRAPVATHMVWYKVGGADEPKGKSGIAHFLEHLMFKGTEKNPGGFSKQVAELVLPIQHDKGRCTECTIAIRTTALMGCFIHINPAPLKEPVFEDCAIFRPERCQGV